MVSLLFYEHPWQMTFSFESDMIKKYVVPPELVKNKQQKSHIQIASPGTKKQKGVVDDPKAPFSTPVKGHLICRPERA